MQQVGIYLRMLIKFKCRITGCGLLEAGTGTDAGTAATAGVSSDGSGCRSVRTCLSDYSRFHWSQLYIPEWRCRPQHAVRCPATSSSSMQWTSAVWWEGWVDCQPAGEDKVYTRTHASTCTHKHKNTQTHTYTHTYTHTCTYAHISNS